MNNTSVHQQKSKKNVKKPFYYDALLLKAQCRKNWMDSKNSKNEGTPEELSWFKIKNYDFVRDLTLRDLLIELVVRADLCTQPDVVTRYGCILSKTEDYSKTYPRIISGEPAIHEFYKSHDKIPDLCYLAEDDDISTPALALPVREMSIRDIDACHDALSFGEKKYYTLEESLHPCRLSVSKSSLNPDTPLTDIQRRPFCMGIEQIYLAVDPSFTESQLIASFREILADINTRHGIFTSPDEPQSTLRKKTLYDIHAYHIIPLIDLVLWQIQNRKKIPLRNVYNLLKNNQFDAPSSSTGYSETNFRNANLKTFDLIMNQGNPSAVVKKLIDKEDDYNLSFNELTRK